VSASSLRNNIAELLITIIHVDSLPVPVERGMNFNQYQYINLVEKVVDQPLLHCGSKGCQMKRDEATTLLLIEKFSPSGLIKNVLLHKRNKKIIGV
jgi:hypothetical protein